jgi:hypothetical protein
MTYGISPSLTTYVFAIIAIAVVVLATIISMITCAIRKKMKRMIASEPNSVKAALMCCAHRMDCDNCPLKYASNCRDVLIMEAHLLIKSQDKLIAKFGKKLTGGNV